jgi:class 3 adenylate cyclase
LRDGTVVPDSGDIALGNEAVKLDATVLYADLADSTEMVRTKKKEFSAEVYKAYLDSACRIIRRNGGEVTAFDGDRVMAVFIGKSKNTSAVASALNIQWAVNILNEEIRKKWRTDLPVRQCVGIDASEVWIAKTGIRGSNDLVWVGTAANYAAKLTTLGYDDYSSWITERVYNGANESVRLNVAKTVVIWEQAYWDEQNSPIYKTRWWRTIS